MTKRERNPVAVIAEIKASVPKILKIINDMAGTMENIPIAILIINQITNVEASIFLFLIK